MTDHRAGESSADSSPGRLRRLADEYPELLSIGAYAAVAIVATITAYFTIFTTFAPYDDEGTLLIGLRAFVDGESLYRDIWSVYGPFYYELFGGFFSLFGQEVTNNAGRTIVLVVWIAASLGFGVAAHRLTRNLWLGLTGTIAAFGSLVVLANEPMHPQGLCVLLLGGFTLLVTGPSRRPVWFGAGAGALLAALLMTKVNLGVFAIAALVVAAAFTVWPFASRASVRWLLGGAFLAMPVAVLARDLDLAWTRELALLEILALAAVLVAARPLRPTAADRTLQRWLFGAATGFVVALVAIIAILLATGPSLADAYDGIVRQAMGIRDLLIGQTPFPPVTVLTWGIVALAAAFLATHLMRSPQARPALWSALFRAGTGLVTWLAITHIVVVGLNPSSANPVIVPMLVAWIAAIPPAGIVETSYKRFLRVLLPALAVAETLQIYPVPGSQLGIASVSFVAVGALCFADALTELRAVYSAGPSFRLARLGEVTAVAGVALAAIFAVTTLVMPAAARILNYRENTKLDLRGAGLMRLPAPTVETYEQLVSLLDRHGCTTFIGYPNMGSMYLWSDLPSPAPQPPNGWFYALNEDQQRQAVRELRASPKPCVIKNEEQAANYLRGEPAPDSPLVRYVLDDFKPVTNIGPYEFMLPKASATGAAANRP